MQTQIEQRIHRAFQFSLVLKGLHALIECAGGLVFLFINSAAVLAWTNRLTRNELVEDPRDFVATHLLAAAQAVTGSTLSFYAFYLLSHGLIKLALVAGLWRDLRAAYPASIVALVGFIAYQLYRWSYTGSAALLALTAFDLVVLWLVWHEWRQHGAGTTAH